jgi:hypothetical protein
MDFTAYPVENQTRIDFVGVDTVQGSLIFQFKVQFGKWTISSRCFLKDDGSQLRIAFIPIYSWISVLAPSKLDKNCLRGMGFDVAEYQ